MKIAVILPETRCIRLRQGPWNFGVLAASPNATRFPPMPDRPRRFPPPWDIEEHNRSCFIVRAGFGLRHPANIAKLPRRCKPVQVGGARRL